MEFKVGQRVVAVANGVTYGENSTNDYCHNYGVGWKGTVITQKASGALSINFDNGRVIKGCDESNYGIEEAK
jgi:hypothetical protein